MRTVGWGQASQVNDACLVKKVRVQKVCFVVSHQLCAWERGIPAASKGKYAFKAKNADRICLGGMGILLIDIYFSQQSRRKKTIYGYVPYEATLQWLRMCPLISIAGLCKSVETQSQNLISPKPFLQASRRPIGSLRAMQPSFLVLPSAMFPSRVHCKWGSSIHCLRKLSWMTGILYQQTSDHLINQIEFCDF